MKTHRLAFLLVAGIAAAAGAHAQESRTGGKIVLACPDRSPRMTDIEFAVNVSHMHVSQATYRQMLERARSVCGAGLNVVTLLAPTDPLIATDSALASDMKP
jgi:hypothetical protein